MADRIAYVGTTKVDDSGKVSGQPVRLGVYAVTIEEATTPFETMLQRSLGSRPSPAKVATWEALRDRYQRAVSAAPAAVTDALLAMRLGGSATLARSPEARDAFASGVAIASSISNARRTATVEDLHAMHRAVAPGTGAGQLRGPTVQVRAADDAQRAYLPGALVAQAIEDAFALLASPRVHSLEALELAALIEQRLVSIHPYVDGNGRVARLFSDAILERDGFPPVVATASAALHWQRPGTVAASAHLDRVTDGMRRAVEIAEAIG